VVVVAAAAAATLPQSGIAAPNNFKRLQFVPARRKEASPPPSHSVPIVRLDVPEPLPDKKNVKEAMAREKSASNTAAAAAAAAVVASAVAAAAGKKKKNAKTSSSRPPARELFPSASFQMRWAEPLKPVRIGVLYACFLVCVCGGGRERPERERHRNEKKENPETKKNSPLSFSLSLSRSLSLVSTTTTTTNNNNKKTGRRPPEPRQHLLHELCAAVPRAHAPPGAGPAFARGAAPRRGAKRRH